VLNPWRLRLLGLLDSLGTVRAVAETLHLSPSTVSQQLLRHVESGRSVALLPALAVAPSHAVVTRELTAPVHRNVAVVVRRGSAPRAAVDAVVEALLDHPAIPALADDPDHGRGPRSRAT